MSRYVFSASLALAIGIPVWANGAPSVSSKGLPQTADSAKAGQNGLQIPAETPIIARLVSEVDIRKCKLGDQVEAQVTHDVKVDRQTLVKRGSRIVGQISKLQTTPDAEGRYKIGILFDSVVAKNSAPAGLHLEVQAMAPPPVPGTDNARDPRGMAQTNIDAGAKGGLSGTEGPQGELTEKSKGPIGLPGLELETEISQGTHTTILSSTKGNLKLAKDSQIVFRVVNP